MGATAASFVEALSAEEICPLCLDHYFSADECTCVICHGPSCPRCAEVVGDAGALRCYACRPALGLDTYLDARPALVLPRPISFPADRRTSKPAARRLPFGLGTLGLPLRGRDRSGLVPLITLIAPPTFGQRAFSSLRARAQRMARRAASWVETAQRVSSRLAHADYRRSLSTLYNSGRRSLKKPIEALSSRILPKSKSATSTPSSSRPNSTNL
jgi:hypothetical protein